MKEVRGDLIKMAKNGDFDVIVHGANCFCVMGAGIAKQIAKEFPEAYKKDKATTPGDHNKLGGITAVKIKDLWVVNAYTQYSVGTKERQVDYDAVRQCFKRISKRFGDKCLRFGVPAIGAGLGGGDWSIISKIIDEEMVDEDLTLVKFSG